MLLIGLQQPATSPATPASPARQTPAHQKPEPTAINPNDLPVSLDRIQRALEAPPPIQLKEQHPVFRLEVFGKKPTLEDLLGEKFWLGPTPYGGMTHQEFLNMVTPKEVPALRGVHRRVPGGGNRVDARADVGPQGRHPEVSRRRRKAVSARRRARRCSMPSPSSRRLAAPPACRTSERVVSVGRGPATSRGLPVALPAAVPSPHLGQNVGGSELST